MIYQRVLRLAAQVDEHATTRAMGGKKGKVLSIFRALASARYGTRFFPRLAFMAMKNRRCTSVNGASSCCRLSPG